MLETIDLDAIDSRGYAFQIETTYRAIRAGFRVVEVPITFADREVGGSKMSKSIVLEAIWKVPAPPPSPDRPSLAAMSGDLVLDVTDDTFERGRARLGASPAA